MNHLSVERRESGIVRPTWRLALVIGLAVSVPLAYTVYTSHVWEDYFITFRFSQNLVHGKGLVFNEGERVHGFTSPLGVLLPALFYAAIGRESYEPALWLFRAVSIAAYTAAAWLVFARLRRSGTVEAAAWFFLLLYLADVKSAAFTTNGMETGFMLLFVAWAIYLLEERDNNWLARGLCWAGLMWTRPDGCVYIGVLCLAQTVFTRGRRGALIRSFAQSAAVCAAVYGPWVAWAWIYYGSPVPNTILAKSLYHTRSYTRFIELVLEKKLRDYFWRSSTLVYAPVYFISFYRGWPPWLEGACATLSLAISLYWILPVDDRLGRMTSLSFLLLCLYETIVPEVFPWYLPPIALFGSVTIARACLTIAGPLLSWRWMVYVLASAIPAVMAYEFVQTAREMKVQQLVIEEHGRKQVGLWLREHCRPGELVVLESLGYIGFFSGCQIEDFPGLVSSRVVELRREGAVALVNLVDRLKPAYAVMRGRQKDEMTALPEYQLVRSFDVSDEVRAYPDMPGRDYLDFDAVYLVYKRN
jgi:hypothetical protein